VPGATVDEIAACDERTRKAYARYLNPPNEELYDLQADPWEYTNLIDDEGLATVREELRTKLAEWQTETDDRIVDPEVLGQLTREHDEITASHYAKSAWGSGRDFEWKYAAYLYGNKPG